MAQFIEYLSADALSDEPISLDEVKTQARIDLDLTDDDLFIQTVLIPSARQQAETRTGSIIRPARYRQWLSAFPHHRDPLWLATGNVQTVESLTWLPNDRHVQGLGRQTFDLTKTDLVTPDRESALMLQSGHWPHAARQADAIEVVLTAGSSPQDFSDRYPSVKVWMLMAAAWGYAQRESLFMQTKGTGILELPTEFMQTLLEPLKLYPRW
jgi:uncharacterized phiE125 gp8 family phage protein